MTQATGTVGLLLAAGRGSRFDPTGEKSKLLQTLDGEPIVVRAYASLAVVCPNIIAVIRPQSPELRRCLEQIGAQVVECADAHLGMGHSVAFGIAQAKHLYNPDKVVVMLGDMPRVEATTLRTLIQAINEDVQAVAPEYKGQRGNPVVFGSMHFEALETCCGDRGAAGVLAPRQIHRVTVTDPGVLGDIDSPDDLEAARTKRGTVDGQSA
jgi:molybdenum cofactor cytidylyltransferase